MHEHEKKTIDAFILKEKRQRYQYLLDDPEKRGAGLSRLNHRNDFKPNCVHWLPRKADVAELLKKEGCPSHVYVISLADEIDRRTLPLLEALELTTYYGWGTIISCIPGILAYYYDEEGERRALLKKEL